VKSTPKSAATSTDTGKIDAASSAAARPGLMPQFAVGNPSDPEANLKPGPAKATAKAKAAHHAVPLKVSLAEAFGPDGASDGDNPNAATNPLNPHSAQPWNTDWYTSAKFGNLKPGTGLLLDMGQRVAVSRVAVHLGSGEGASLKLLAGNAPALDDLKVAASAADAGGDVVLHASTKARYLLLWFTSLPVSGNGQYEASVYSVSVAGHA
jgi:hypothetical protein